MGSRPFRLQRPSRRTGQRHVTRPLVERMESRRLLATFSVTNTDDSGPGTLREAILQANAQPGADSIVFQVPTSTASDFDVPVSGFDPITQNWRITLTSPLPVITDQLTIDGYTQAHVPCKISISRPDLPVGHCRRVDHRGTFTLTSKTPFNRALELQPMRSPTTRRPPRSLDALDAILGVEQRDRSGWRMRTRGRSSSNSSGVLPTRAWELRPLPPTAACLSGARWTSRRHCSSPPERDRLLTEHDRHGRGHRDAGKQRGPPSDRRRQPDRPHVLRPDRVLHRRLAQHPAGAGHHRLWGRRGDPQTGTTWAI